MVNKNYPAEFKADAVALYRSRPGTPIARIAVDLGVDRETLRRWIRADDQAQVSGPAGRADGSAVAARPAPTSVEQENEALRRRVRELEEERDILRKAARYFAGETRWSAASSSSPTTRSATA